MKGGEAVEAAVGEEKEMRSCRWRWGLRGLVGWKGRGGAGGISKFGFACQL